jgi:hypothetical protein
LRGALRHHGIDPPNSGDCAGCSAPRKTNTRLLGAGLAVIALGSLLGGLIAATSDRVSIDVMPLVTALQFVSPVRREGAWMARGLMPQGLGLRVRF